MNLLVDVGNTRIKWACDDNGALFGHGACTYAQDTLPEQLASNWRALMRPERVYLASVSAAEVTAGLSEYARAAWGLEPRQAVAEKERAGLRNAYDDVAALGVDRWLAMLAAWTRYKQPVCVIDCGTAVTVDVVLEDGRHAGGFILPGLSLMATALAQDTHGIQEQRARALQLEFGRSTAACISNGFAFALAGLIDRCAGEVRRQEGVVELLSVVTGGGAEQALPLLPGHPVHEPHLVLQGLGLASR